MVLKSWYVTGWGIHTRFGIQNPIKPQPLKNRRISNTKDFINTILKDVNLHKKNHTINYSGV